VKSLTRDPARRWHNQCVAARIGAVLGAKDRRLTMLREHTIQFLECTIVFLLLTNALSVVAATYAIWVAHGFADKRRELTAVIQRKAETILRRPA